MQYHIAEQTPDLLVIRTYWDKASTAAGHLKFAVVYCIVGFVFGLGGINHFRWWVTILIMGGGCVLTIFFLLVAYNQYWKVNEKRYVFDRKRNTFEVLTRKVRGAPFDVESHPLAFVEGATVDLEYDEGYRRFILIRILEDKRVRFQWWDKSNIDAEQLMKTINDFLCTPEVHP
jgi:hypothetical protein